MENPHVLKKLLDLPMIKLLKFQKPFSVKTNLLWDKCRKKSKVNEREILISKMQTKNVEPYEIRIKITGGIERPLPSSF